MKDTYTELFYHFIWTTKGREPMITPLVQETLDRYVLGTCRERGVRVYALGGMPDHVHLACTMPTICAIADLMQQIKGGSAHLINHLPDPRVSLRWRPGYGALTFSAQDLKRLVAYVENQETHHRTGTLYAKLERCTEAETPSSSPAGASRFQ